MSEPTDQPRSWPWGRVFAGAGVILSLLFVAAEIRQNTNAIRGGTFQQASEARREMVMEFVHDHSLQEAYDAWRGFRPWSEMSAESQSRIETWVAAYMVFLDDAYYQVRLGALPQSAFEGWLLQTDNPQMREFWGRSSHRFTPEFRAYLKSVQGLGDAGS
jgi:hypothetical protein